MKTFIQRIALVVMLVWALPPLQIRSAQHYDDLGDLRVLAFSSQSNTWNDSPVIHFGFVGLNTYGRDDYAHNIDMYAVLSGGVRISLGRIPNGGQGSIHNAPNNTSDRGHVKYRFDTDGSAGFKWHRHFIDLHLPAIAMGRNVTIEVQYDYYHDKNYKGRRTKNLGSADIKGITDITKSVVASWAYSNGAPRVKAVWSGAAEGGYVYVNNQKFEASANVGVNGSSVVANNDQVVEWRYERTFQYSKWDVTRTLTPSWNGSISLPRLAKPVGVNAVYDMCEKSVELSWQITDGTKSPQFIFRKRAKDSSWEKIAEVSSSATSYSDSRLSLNTDYEYAVSAIPSGFPSNEFESFNLFASANVRTATRNYTINLKPLAFTDNAEKRVVAQWDAIEGICPNNSKIDLVVTNTTTSVQSVYKVTDLNSTSITTDALVSCQTMRYFLRLTYDGTEYESNTQELYDADPPVFISLKATKGVYPTKVMLSWGMDKPKIVDNFQIYRKLLHEGQDKFQLIASKVDASPQITYTDEDAIAGNFYTYKIVSNSICGSNPIATSMEDIGFVQPYGIVAGRIQYKGGTAVANVAVRLEKLSADETAEQAYRSLQFNGQAAATASFALSENRNNANALPKHPCVRDNFSFQAMLRGEYTSVETETIAQMGDEFVLERISNGSQLKIKVGNAIGVFDFVRTRFVQLSVSSASDSVRVYMDGVQVGGMIANRNVVCSNPHTFVMGAMNNGFVGFIDEVRLWNRALSAAEIQRNREIYLSGSEPDLMAYWRFDEALSSHFFDLAHQDLIYNENHGTISGAMPSKTVPNEAQLALKGYTSREGNYLINGIPYGYSGSTYSIVPSYETHQFEPSIQNRHIGGGGPSVINAIDFVDISSFAVSGEVKYKDTEFPVEGAFLYIDGEVAKSATGKVIQTDVEGRYKIDVPIGRHQVSIGMTGHTFEADRFPYAEADPDATHNFQTDLTNINFVDKTLVKYVGRVAGGRVERDKALGFGISENNLGKAVVIMNPENTRFYLNHPNNAPREIADTIAKKECKTIINLKEIRIEPNDETGEFVAYLPPLKYNILTVSGGDYFIPTDQLTQIDMLASMPMQNSELKDENGDVIAVYPYQYKSIFSYIEKKPTISAFQKGTDAPMAFGDSIIEVRKFNSQTGEYDVDSLKLYVQKEEIIQGEDESGAMVDIKTGEMLLEYLFDKPVFSQNGDYKLEFTIDEEYTNSLTGKTYKLPYLDGKFKITNNLSRDKDVELELDSTGIMVYEFNGGYPVMVPNLNNPEKSFIQTLQVELVTSSNEVYTWSDLTEGYVFGIAAEGTDFVTDGPDLVSHILRDPPGSHSSMTMEEGTVTTSEFNFDINSSQSGMVGSQVKGGFKGFIGFGVLAESNAAVGLTVTNSFEFEESLGGRFSWSSEMNKSYSTSSEPDWVGASADIYVGTGTNVTFGMSRALAIFYEDDPLFKNESDKYIKKEVAGKQFTIGIQPAIRVDLGFKTDFIYTQDHIQNTLIPNLIELRNSFLTYSDNPANGVAEDRKSYYYTNLKPGDFGYGTKNSDPIWGDLASEQSENGPSYYYRIANSPSESEKDEVAFYNNAIQKWENEIANNERAKLEVSEKGKENISFSSGTSYTKSVSETDSKGFAGSFSFTYTHGFKNEVEASVAGSGVNTEFEVGYSVGTTIEESTTVEKTTGFSYTLQDDDTNNYFSVDCFPSTGANSPIFKKKAGRSSCPYEDATVTDYFKPGTKIDEATVQIEKPKMSISRNVASDVPGGTDALFTLTLMNETVADVPASLLLKYDDTTNQNGAILMIDGLPLTSEGRLFEVSKDTPFEKTLAVRQGRTDVHSFENIKLTLCSECDSEIASDQQISVYYTPSSSNVEVKVKDEQSIVNIPSGSVIPIEVSELQLDYINFATVAIQYKSINASLWSTICTYVNPSRVDVYENIENALYIPSSSFTHLWDMENLPDGRYEVRAVTSSITQQGGVIAENKSESKQVLKDATSPKEIGKPQPTTGVLTPSESIMITFNEDINQPMVSRMNLKVEGELNGYTVREDVGLEFNGGTDCATTEADLNLSGKSFSIELWTRHQPDSDGVILSHGDQTESMDIFFDEQNFVNVHYKNKRVKSVRSVNNDTWVHLSFIYDATNETLSAYVMGQNILDAERWIIQDAPIGVYSLSGKVRVGGSLTKGSVLTNYTGYINELRVWTSKRSLNDVSASAFTTLSGLENGLAAYWPLSEGRGELAKDKVLAKNLQVNCPWYIYPKGYAAKFDGETNMIEFNPGFVATRDNSYTIEFWFRGEPQKNANLYTYSTYKRNHNLKKDSVVLAIGFDEAGLLAVWANGQKYPCGSNSPLDNQWHHLAFVLNRASNANLYLDSEMRMSVNHGLFAPLMDGTAFLGGEGYQRDLSTGAAMTELPGVRLFKGSIDEFRGWMSALSQNQLEIDINSRMKGDESGLAAYYPFDEYHNVTGTIDVQPVFKDLMKNDMYANAGELVVKGANYSTNGAAPIKDSRPKEAVNFNYTVSDRQIQIDVIEPIERIEGTVLEFTVDNVPDVYSNLQTSPVKWTAFVQLNTMKWKENNMYIEMKPAESPTFTVDIHNTSGNKQNFVIENIPSWLTLSTSSGILQPLENKSITFTISSSLSIGRFEEILYLKGGSNITSPLLVNVKVNGERPNWNVNPAQYDYSMNVIGQLKIEDIISTDTEDILGVFVGEECIGLASPEYMPAQDNYALFLSIFNNKKSGQQIEFRIWDASTGRIYPSVKTINPEITTFEADTSFGELAYPVVFNALNEVQLDLNLNAGWNWISSNVEDVDLVKPSTIFDEHKQNVNQIKSINAALVYVNNQWLGDLEDDGNDGFKLGYGYKVQMKEPARVKLIGSMAVSKDLPISINKGWTWIGYTPTIVAPINTALATLQAEDGDLIKSQKSFAMYYKANGGWIGSLKSLNPGVGYMIQMNNAKTFAYPTIKSSASRSALMRSKAMPTWVTPTVNTQSNMTIVADVYQDDVKMNAHNVQIAAFSGSECRGAAVLDVTGSYFLTVAGATNETINFRAYDVSTNNEVTIDESMKFIADKLSGTFNQPHVFRVKGLPTGVDASKDRTVAIYPTYVKETLTVDVNSSDDFSIQIYDVFGKLVYFLEKTPSVVINMTDFVSGSYIVVVESEFGTTRKKIVKQ